MGKVLTNHQTSVCMMGLFVHMYRYTYMYTNKQHIEICLLILADIFF